MSDLITILSIFGAIVGYIHFNDTEFKKQFIKLKLLNEKKTILLIGLLSLIIFYIESDSDLKKQTFSNYYGWVQPMFFLIICLFFWQLSSDKYIIKNKKLKFNQFRLRSLIVLSDVEQSFLELIYKKDFHTMSLLLNQTDLLNKNELKSGLFGFNSQLPINQNIFNDPDLINYLYIHHPSKIPLLLNSDDFTKFIKSVNSIDFFLKIKYEQYPENKITDCLIFNIRGLIWDLHEKNIQFYKLLSTENNPDSVVPKIEVSDFMLNIIIYTWVDSLKDLKDSSERIVINRYNIGIKYLLKCIVTGYDYMKNSSISIMYFRKNDPDYVPTDWYKTYMLKFENLLLNKRIITASLIQAVEELIDQYEKSNAHIVLIGQKKSK